MNALSRLFWALPEFNHSWRAHAATMRAATVLSFSQELAPLLAASINLAKGLDPGFDGTAAIEDLHNGCHARDGRYLQVLGESFLAGQKLVIDKVRLGKCVNQVRLCVNQVADGTPYLDAI